MFMIDYKEISWWYWLATVCLLMAGLAVNPDYYFLAIALTIIQIIHFSIRERSITAFPVQVRFYRCSGYTGFQLLGRGHNSFLAIVRWRVVYRFCRGIVRKLSRSNYS